MANIFIVEDDPFIRDMELYALNNSGFLTEAFSCAADFYRKIESELPDLVLLDIMLPVEDGLSILNRLKSERRTRKIPVIMVTAKTTEIDKVRGLDMGADDYLTKPFGIRELISRINAVLRRSASETGRVNVYRDIRINDDEHTVTVNGKTVELTYKEYALLRFLIENPNKALTREKLMDEVWGFDFAGESRTVDMHIKTLRQKLGESGKFIVTVRNVGYKLGE